MSWRAALLYVVVAVLAGSFFVAAAYYADSASSWALEDRRVSGFLFVFGLTAAGAAPTLLLYAAILWTLTRILRWSRAAQWMAAGAILGIAVPWTLSALGYFVETAYFPAELQRLKRGLIFPLIGPMMYGAQPVWVRLAIGAATSAVLWLLVRMHDPSHRSNTASRSTAAP